MGTLVPYKGNGSLLAGNGLITEIVNVSGWYRKKESGVLFLQVEGRIHAGLFVEQFGKL